MKTTIQFDEGNKTIQTTLNGSIKIEHGYVSSGSYVGEVEKEKYGFYFADGKELFWTPATRFWLETR
jgi:hypothetical protein